MCFPKGSAAFILMHAEAFRRELVKERRDMTTWLCLLGW
jgi:hypothetical protein